MTRIETRWVQIADAHGALSSICAALRGPEYLGYDSRKRLLLHATIIRRALEAIETLAREGAAR